jgi:hypothetical protein
LLRAKLQPNGDHLFACIEISTGLAPHNTMYNGYELVTVCVRCGASECGQHPWDWKRSSCKRHDRNQKVSGVNPDDAHANDWAYYPDGDRWVRNTNFNLPLGVCAPNC